MTPKPLPRLQAPPLETIRKVGRVILSLALVAFVTWVGVVVYFELVTALLL